MKQTALRIIPTEKRDATKRKQLLVVIRKKRLQLQQWVIKTETLKVNLEMAKQEYMVKVGNLFIKDNHLDLEIIRMQNILRLMNEGKSYEDAAEALSETYYSQQADFEREQEKIREDEAKVEKRQQQDTKKSTDIKKLWKKLIARFHPDLVQDKNEKQQRDAIMKAINRAYQENDYEQLVKIEQDNIAHPETSIESLEEVLINVMREIDEQIVLFGELKTSEWYDWMQKIDRAKKKKINVFTDTEKKLLNDILAKFKIISQLRTQIETKTGFPI